MRYNRDYRHNYYLEIMKQHIKRREEEREIAKLFMTRTDYWAKVYENEPDDKIMKEELPFFISRQ